MLPILRNKVKRIRKRRRTLLKVVSPQKKEKRVSNDLLDTLFAFIGVS